jgi:putative transcriptional regulator
MSQPTRHPSDELILDFARGALEEGRALVLASHMAVCPQCRASARIAEAVGGAVIDEIEPAELAPDALAKALAQIDRPPTPPPAAPALAAPDDWIRVPADVLIAAERHKRWAAPGVWVAQVTRNEATGARSYLLGVAANMAVPLHSHRGLELVCVVKGAYKDRGRIYGLGDFAENDEAVEHQPKVTRDGECVCLIAADNALVPRNLQARLLQPLVGI